MNLFNTRLLITAVMTVLLTVPCRAQTSTQVEIDGLIYDRYNAGDEAIKKYEAEVVRVADSYPMKSAHIQEKVILNNGYEYPVTRIDAYAFKNCRTLTEVTIPSSVTYISGEAFDGCMSLKSVVLPPDCEYIGYDAFADCTSLEEIKFSGTVDRIDFRAFSNTAISELILPESSAGTPEIMYNFVNGCNNLKRIVIKSQSIRVADGNGFNRTYTLDNFTLSDKVDVILRENHDSDFDYDVTTHVNAFRVPDSWLEDGDNIEREFEQDNIGYILNHRLNQAVVIHHYTYRAVPEVTIPQSVTFNGKSYTVVGVSDVAFQACNATKINFPSSVKFIGSGCFAACPTLETLSMSEATTLYSKSAFYNSTALKEVELPSVGFETIQTNAFSGCSSLNKVKFHKGTKGIDDDAFYNCPNINVVDIADVREWLDMNLRPDSRYCNPLYPEGETYASSYDSKWLDEEAWSTKNYGIDGCVTLLINGKDASTLEIPEGVETIRRNAFARCENIRTLILPSSLTEVVRDAFYGCSGLETVVCKSLTAPATHNTIFNHEILDNALLVVDKNADHSYDVPNTTSIWYKFAKSERRDTSSGYSGIDEIPAEENSDAPIEYYNLQGIRVHNPEKGIYIRRQGSTSTKIVL